MQKFRNLLILAMTISSVFLPLEITNAQEKIELIPLIQSTKGIGGEKISYPRRKQAELRFFKVIIPVGVKTPIHTSSINDCLSSSRGIEAYERRCN